MVGFKLTELCAVVWVDTFVIVFYLFVYAGVARSVSLTLLAQLSASTGSVNMDRLVADYLASSRLRDRIELMRASGLVRVTGDVVALTRRGARVAQGASLLSRLTCGDLRG